MDINNPYTPPRAAVADIHADDATEQQPKVWSAKGRIGRLRLLCYLMVGYIAVVAIAAVLGGVVGAIMGGTGNVAGLDDAVNVVVFIAVVPYLVLMVLCLIQRSHDMGWSGWTALLALIPLVVLIWYFYPGTKGPNRYGPPPTPNTVGIKIGAFLPLVLVVGILAAVAIPAYQSYVTLERAQQSAPSEPLAPAP